MEQQKGLTGSTLKIIAMVTMLIDHIGASILERGVMQRQQMAVLWMQA